MSEVLVAQEEGLKSLELYFSKVCCMSSRAHIRRMDHDDMNRSVFFFDSGHLMALEELPRRPSLIFACRILPLKSNMSGRLKKERIACEPKVI